MKQLIVMLASILLGIFLFSLIAGKDESSLYSSTKRLWQEEIRLRTAEDRRLVL